MDYYYYYLNSFYYHFDYYLKINSQFLVNFPRNNLHNFLNQINTSQTKYIYFQTNYIIIRNDSKHTNGGGITLYA